MNNGTGSLIMLNFIFRNKKGVTVLEGLISLGLLSIVAVGIFGVLLSISRKTNEPDLREEVAMAVERAQEGLQLYAGLEDMNTDVSMWTTPVGSNLVLPTGLCSNDPDTSIIDNTPLALGVHQIDCLLPPICDPARSSFSYEVHASEDYAWLTNLGEGCGTACPYDYDNEAKVFHGYDSESGTWTTGDLNYAKGRPIEFTITCNGYRL